MRAHRARENSTRLGRVALSGGPVCVWERGACVRGMRLPLTACCATAQHFALCMEGVVWELPLNWWCVLGPDGWGARYQATSPQPCPLRAAPASRPCHAWPPRRVHAACAAYVRAADRSAVPPAASAVPPAAAAANGEIRARDRAHCRRDHRARLSTGMCACGRRCWELLPWPRGVAHGGPCRYARRISLGEAAAGAGVCCKRLSSC